MSAPQFSRTEALRFPRTSGEAFKGPEYANAIEGFADDMPPGWFVALVLACAASVVGYAACVWAGVL